VNDVYLLEAPTAAPADVTLGEERAVPPVIVGGGYRRRPALPAPPPLPAREPQAWVFHAECEAHVEVALAVEVVPVGRWLMEEILELV
jgi:hypothetical protein